MDRRFPNLWRIDECPLVTPHDRASIAEVARQVCERTNVHALLQSIHGRVKLYFYAKSVDHGVAIPERHTIVIDRAGERRSLAGSVDAICRQINLIRRPRAIEERMMAMQAVAEKSDRVQENGRAFDAIRKEVARCMERQMRGHRRVYSFAQ